MSPQTAQLDHLIVAAATLEEGVAWCEATLGVTPGPGGEHALFGTHNRLLKLDCDGAPNAYLEIIAINPKAEPMRAPPLKRWFDLDDPVLQASFKTHGPQPVHWVASVPDLPVALAACSAQGVDRGHALTASRPTPQGLLQWQISVRDDGQRLMNGCLPTLIEWGATHPGANMRHSGLRLEAFELFHPEAVRLNQTLQAIGLHGPEALPGAPSMRLRLSTPKGEVTLKSP